jgi:hypothetical protein
MIEHESVGLSGFSVTSEMIITTGFGTGDWIHFDSICFLNY